MGFFSDLAMGFGAKPKTKDYVARTAATIARNEGKSSAADSGRASRYQAQYGVTAADIGNTTDTAAKKSRPKSQPLSNIETKPTTTKTSKSSAKAGAQYAASMKKANELAKAGKLRRPGTTKTIDTPGGKVKVNVPGKLLSDAKPIRNLAASPSISMEEAKAAGANIGTGYDSKTQTGYTDTAGQGLGTDFTLSGNKDDQGNLTGTTFTGAGDIMTTGPSKYGLQNTLLGKGISYLSGVRGNDKIVNTVGGKPIFQRADGSFYAFDAVGLPYDIADPEVGSAPSTLDIDPEVRERMMNQQKYESTNDGQPLIDVASEKDPEDPCPEGYMMDPTTKQCVIDPFKTPFPDPVTGGGGAVVPAGLTPYTQMAPVSLAQLQPSRVANANPLAMQQAQMPQGGLGTLGSTLRGIFGDDFDKMTGGDMGDRPFTLSPSGNRIS